GGEAPDAPADAQRAGEAHRQMPDLSRAVEMPADEPSIHDQAGANPRADGHRGQRRGASHAVDHPTSEGESVHVVVDEDGVAGSRVDEAGEWYVSQVGEKGEGHRSHESLLDVDEAGKAEADPGNPEPALLGGGEGAIDQGEDRVHHRTGPASGRLSSSEDGAVWANQPRRDRRGLNIPTDNWVHVD